MDFKLVFLIFCSLSICQIFAYTVSRQERDTDDASKTIDNFITDIKTGFGELVNKVQNNEVFQSFSTSMQQFGREIADGSKKIAEDTQRAFSTK